jgi:hypothetical protein
MKKEMIDRAVIEESINGIQRLINTRAAALSHIKGQISGEQFYLPSDGGVSKSYLSNINAGLRLNFEITKLRAIKLELRYILELQELSRMATRANKVKTLSENMCVLNVDKLST